MTELDIIDIFYDELRARGEACENLYLDIDETFAAKLSQQLGETIMMADLYQFADICIANRWLIRTTADVEYNFLSLTEAGLQVAIARHYT